MRPIDADAANKEIEKVCNDYGIAYGNNCGGFADKIATVIDNIPTIDAEPVVRCKDCKHHIEHKYSPTFYKCGQVSFLAGRLVSSKFGCVLGEKMDEEDK